LSGISRVLPISLIPIPTVASLGPFAFAGVRSDKVAKINSPELFIDINADPTIFPRWLIRKPQSVMYMVVESKLTKMV